MSGARHSQSWLPSNKTYYSSNDPDARISVEPGKARALNYTCSLAVDMAQGVTNQVQVDLTDRCEACTCPGCLLACSSAYGPMTCPFASYLRTPTTPTAQSTLGAEA